MFKRGRLGVVVAVASVLTVGGGVTQASPSLQSQVATYKREVKTTGGLHFADHGYTSPSSRFAVFTPTVSAPTIPRARMSSVRSGLAARSVGAGTLLQRTLLAVANDPKLDGYFEFGDVAAQRTLAGVPTGVPRAGNHIWGAIVGVGTSAYGPDLDYGDIGINPLSVDLALEVGRLPYSATEARGGVHSAALRAVLLRLGAKPGTIAGHADLVWGAANSLHITAPFGALGEYDRTVLETDLVVAGSSTDPVADLLSAGRITFAANPVIVATTACLGDVIAADGRDYRGTEIAVGVQHPSNAASTPVEVICAVPSRSSRGAAADAATLQTTLSAKSSSLPGFTTLVHAISHSTVSEGSADATRFVRGTLYDRPGQPAGVVLTAFDDGPLVPVLLGLP